MPLKLFFTTLNVILVLSIINEAALADSSLVAYWNFEHVDGNTIVDITGNGHDATSPNIETSEGIAGSALLINKTRITPVIANSQESFYIPKFTIESWINLSSYPTATGEIYNQYKIFEYTSLNGSNYNGFSLFIEDTVPAICVGLPKQWINCFSPVPVRLNKWYHVVGTCEDSKLKLYLNGELVQTVTFTGNYIMPEADAAIGCQIRSDYVGPQCCFRGKIDELKFYNRALDSATIKNNYNSLKPLSKAVAHWNFETIDNNTVLDVTGNGHNASSPNLSLGEGVSGNALLLNKRDIKPTVSDSRIPFYTPQFSIESWINLSSYPAATGEIYNQFKILEYSSLNGTNRNGFSLFIQDRAPALAIGLPGQWINCISPLPLKLNRWYHVVGTCDGSTLRFYVDGELVQTAKFSGNYQMPEADAVIGCQIRSDYKGPQCVFNGMIDELKLYNYVLEESVISQNFSSFVPDKKDHFEINFGMKSAYAKPGDTVSIPVFITNFEDISFSSFNLKSSYDSSKISFIGATKDSGLISSWELFAVAETEKGSLSIAAAGTTSPIQFGEGELFRFLFKVNDDASIGDSAIIKFSDVQIDEKNTLILASSTHCKIYITADFLLYGDITGDNNVTVTDAQKVLSYVVGSLELPDVCCPNFTTEIADVSGNGSITSYDAALILQHSIGLLPEFPCSMKKQLAKAALSKTKQVLGGKVSMVYSDNGNTISYQILGSNLKGFISGDFSIQFNQDLNNLSKGEITTSLRQSTLTSKIDSLQQVIKIALTVNDDIDDDGQVVLFKIDLPSKSNISPALFKIQSISINEGLIPSTFIDNTTPSIPELVHNNTSSFLFKTTRNAILLKAGNSTKTSVKIWSIDGKLVKTINLERFQQISLSTENFSKGMYLFQSKADSDIYSGKFIIGR